MAPRTCLVELTATFRLEGTFDGGFVADFRNVHFGLCDEPAKAVVVAHGTFTGEVDGAPGSFDFIIAGKIDAKSLAEGDLVIGRGADELPRLNGRITLTGITGVGGAYDGRIHFARYGCIL